MLSGNIKLLSPLKINIGNLTIAGQTAPGDGICIQDYPTVINDGANNIIVRYIRFRLGDLHQLEDDSFWGRNCKDIIIDHCSMSWSIDECASFYDNENFTMQYCIISESLYHSYHSKGDHGYGGIWGGWGATFHHNLLAHHSSRNPRFNGSRYTIRPDKEVVDFANNVIYNWGDNSAYGGEAGTQYLRNNYYKHGFATSYSVYSRIVEPYDTAGFWYVNGNHVEGNATVTEDNWNGGVQGTFAAYQKNKRILEADNLVNLSLQSAQEAYEEVLKNAGANFPKRDLLDARIIEETATRNATYGGLWGRANGIIDSQNSVGGWPVLNSIDPPTDTDHDGMPDQWEADNNLDLTNYDDRNTLDSDGYTMLEVYLNELLIEAPTLVEDEAVLSNDFRLHQNYPNPFNPSTKINFNIATSGYVNLVIYNVLGEKIKVLVDDFRQAGYHSVKFNTGNNEIPSGIYFAKLSSGSSWKIIKMLLMK